MATTKRTTKGTRKKKPSKKPARKSKTNGGSLKPPMELKLENGTLKYRLKAAGLQFQKENNRVVAEVQPQLNVLLQQAQKKDEAWVAAQAEQEEAIDEVVAELVQTIPSDYAVQNVNFSDGIVTAVYDPEAAKEQRKKKK